jgi:hypothetical protein
MISLILLICGAALVVLDVLVLTTVVHIAVAWWILMLVGAALICSAGTCATARVDQWSDGRHRQAVPLTGRSTPATATRSFTFKAPDQVWDLTGARLTAQARVAAIDR